MIDASDLELTEHKPRVDRHDVADCILRLKTPVALDLVDELVGTSRFVLVDDYEICGGGIVRSIGGEPGSSTLASPSRLVVVEKVEHESGADAASWRSWLAAEDRVVYRLTGRREVEPLVAAAVMLLDAGASVLLSIPPDAHEQVSRLTRSLDPARVETRWVAATR